MGAYNTLRAVIDETYGGASALEVVAAQTGKRIFVLGYALIADTAGMRVQWQSAANDISGELRLDANGGLVVPPVDWENAWLATSPGEALNLRAEVAGYIGGHLNYMVR